MTKNVYAVGFLVFIVTMLVFFGVYFFGYNTNYFNTSMLLNAFLMPAIYTLGAYFSVTAYRKEYKELGFREAFGRAFKPMFMGGFLSMFSIFAFLNFVDTDAKDLLNHQYVERQKTELDKEYTKTKKILVKEEDKAELENKYHERLQSFSPEMIKNKDMFTFKNFTYYFAAVLVFYTILSTFFGTFFKNKTLE